LREIILYYHVTVIGKSTPDFEQVDAIPPQHRSEHGKHPHPRTRTRTDSFYVRQDIDPLADTVPPRHAVESDEEEDEYNPLSSGARSKPKIGDVEVKILGNVEGVEGRKLVIASGEAGKVWARGANLGEQSGAVMVNGVQVCSWNFIQLYVPCE